MGLKLIVLTLLPLVLAGNIPIIQNGVISRTHKVNYENAAGSQKVSGLNYRLPNNSLPFRYDLWLATDVDKNIFEFDGRVKIHIKITKESQVITLHYRQITIENVDLLDFNGTIIKSSLNFEYEEEVEFVRIQLPMVMKAHEELVLDISYNGTLREDLFGFYRGSYQDGDKQIFFATTQFESTDARHAMPCFDEPAIRAVMGLQIRHGINYTAISNMPVASRVSTRGTNHVTTTFQDTIPLQTYLLAFIVSDFDFVSNNDVQTEQRIYGDPARIKRGDGEFALSVIDPILKRFEDILGVKLPISKMDHAAINNFSAGAMENFGLITYKTEELLFIEGESEELGKMSIVEMIAHEYAHQWFGNIVAPKWWSYTWLNEGFADLFSYYIPSLVYPDNDHMQRFKDNQDAAFHVDLQRDSKPLNHYVESPKEIPSKFGIISYQKGGSVLRMFMEALTAPVFLKGVNYYLTEMYLSSATPEDLHRNLQKAYDEANPNNKLDIGKTMASWEDQAGYPIIHVEKTPEGFKVTQSRAGGGSEIYSIPVSLTTSTELDFSSTKTKMWLNTKSDSFESKDSWIMLNFQENGYFKTKYSNDIWASTIESLNANFEDFPADQRVKLFKDLSICLENKSVNGSFGLQMMRYLSKETDVDVWFEVSVMFNFYYDNLFASELEDEYLKFVQSLTTPHLERLGFMPKASEVAYDTELREVLTNFSCKALAPECLKFELKQLVEYVEKYTNESADRDNCNGFRMASESLFKTSLNKIVTDPTKRFSWLQSLGCTLNPVMLQKLLDVAIDDCNDLDEEERLIVFLGTLNKGAVAFEATLDFIKAKFEKIQKIIPDEIKTIINSLAQRIHSETNFQILQDIVNLSAESNTTETNSQDVMSIAASKLKMFLDIHDDIRELFDNQGEMRDEQDEQYTTLRNL